MIQLQMQHHLKLIARAQVPQLEVCWMEGYASSQQFADNELSPEIKNPYPETSKAYQYWQEGFDSGLFNEPPLFPEYQVDLADTKSISLNWLYKASIIAGGAVLCFALFLEIAS
ncbi:hypothetical protein L3V86_02705 [Thiotrichales bacterium 19S11-10]|nr:hypothetical protein [Thiotrichales bacterium 19S11-10]MCF6807134.1 hypothetical protein [Thiotrichales bacterium 19S9-11]MCF6811103.1 hypothetical protein [Thiotrichales bacterium 19S9-12]